MDDACRTLAKTVGPRRGRLRALLCLWGCPSSWQWSLVNAEGVTTHEWCGRCGSAWVLDRDCTCGTREVDGRDGSLVHYTDCESA